MTGDSSEPELDALLNLHGWTDEVGAGFWIAVRVYRVEANEERPHGLSYSLTLHRPGGSRIVGYDNAHWPNIGKGPARRAQRRGRGCDHRHFRGRLEWYDFETPVKLIEDFWADVRTVMDEEGVPWT